MMTLKVQCRIRILDNRFTLLLSNKNNVKTVRYYKTHL